jgi:hypothetical protein
MTAWQRWLACALWACAILWTGCQQKSATQTYVARVGDMHLTQTELQAMLQTVSEADTSGAREQIIEQWVTRTLLYQEALERNLDADPAVQERLETQRRTVLVTTLTDRMYASFDASPSQAEVEAYFERHREQLRLREPYIRVRHLALRSPTAAAQARERLAQAATAAADSVWRRIVRSQDSATVAQPPLPDRLYPASRLREGRPVLPSILRGMSDGEVAPVTRADSLYHVVQLVRRVPAGTSPELSWVAPEIRRRLEMRARKQMVAREVQRLRNEAQARDALDIR